VAHLVADSESPASKAAGAVNQYGAFGFLRVRNETPFEAVSFKSPYFNYTDCPGNFFDRYRKRTFADLTMDFVGDLYWLGQITEFNPVNFHLIHLFVAV